MKKRAQRWLSCLLSLVLVLGLLPTAAFATEQADEPQEKATYRWEPQNGALVSVKGYIPNALTKKNGTVGEDGLLTDIQYQLGTPLELSHDEEWYIQFEGSGDWKGMLFATNQYTPSAGNQYFMRSASSDQLNLGYYNSSSKNKAFWMAVDADVNEVTRYRLENRVTRDESENYVSNEIYLIVNGTEKDATNGTNYVSGTDLVFNFIGSNASSSSATSQLLTGLTLKYLEVYDPSVGVHECDYTVPGEIVEGSNCTEVGYTVMACACGATKNVENGVYGAHAYGAWANVNGEIRRDCANCDDYETATYAWQMNEGKTALVDVNSGKDMAPLKGKVENGVLTNVQYKLPAAVELNVEDEWVIEFKGSGDWQGMLLSETKSSKEAGNHYIFRTSKKYFFVGYYDDGGSSHNANGIDLTNYTDDHTYRMENKVTVDAEGAFVSNEVRLLIDGDFAGTMNAAAVSPSVAFNFIGGATTQYLNGLALDYLMIDIPQEEEPEHTHTYAEMIASGEQATAADCENAATYYVKCDGCDEINRELTVAVGSANDHSFTEYVETVNGANCQSAGYNVYKCANCEETENRTNAEAVGGHNYNVYVETVNGANCQTAGHDVYKCANCEETENRTNTEAVGGHNYNVYVETVNGANCQTAGYDVYKCANCEETTTVVNAAAVGDHSFTDKASNQMETAADCENADTYYVQCDNCDAVSDTKTVVVGDPLGHLDENFDHICDRLCGKDDMGEHKDSADDEDHVCDYCLSDEVLELCSDEEGDGDHACDVCGKADVSEHVYVEHLCECGVRDDLFITQQPETVHVKGGEIASVSVEVYGEGLKYEWWLKNNNGDDNWYKSAIKTRVYSVTMTNARADRQVYCKITDKNGNTVESEIVTLYREPKELKIITQPTDAYAYLGELCRVTMEVQGDGLKYQWYLRNHNGISDEELHESAVQSKNYSVTMTNYRAGREIYCVITDAYGNTVTSDTVTLHRLERELKIVSQPTSGYAKLGEVNKIVMDVQGDGLKYQWYLSNEEKEPDPETWYASAVKSKNYSINMTRAKNGQYLFCVITDAYGNQVQTDVVQLLLDNGQ